MTPTSLAHAPWPARASWAAPGSPDATAPDEPPLAADRAASVEPSFTARIDGVEMDFWSVRMRGDSHLLGSCAVPPADAAPLGPAAHFPDFTGSAGMS